MCNHIDLTRPSDAVPVGTRISPLPADTSPSTPPAATKSQWDRMIAGEPYEFMADPIFRLSQMRSRHLVRAYNEHPLPDPDFTDDYFGPDERKALLGKVFGMTLEEIKEKGVCIDPPFNLNYGCNVHFKGAFFANCHLIILDDAPITIGARVMCGPRVGLYAATHSTDVAERQGEVNCAFPITIGDDCWIGAGAIINGPTTIGRGCTVAAGAVVRGTFPDNCLIGGVPAKIIKYLVPTKGTASGDKDGAKVPVL